MRKIETSSNAAPSKEGFAVRDPNRPRKHPGYYLRNAYLAPLNLSADEFAGYLKVSPDVVSEILNEQRGLDGELALKLSKVFDTSAEFWLNMQNAYDLWQARQTIDLDQYERIEW